MERIGAAIVSNSPRQSPNEAIRVIGTANDILGQDKNLGHDSRATSFRNQQLTIEVNNGAAQAMIYQQKSQIVTEINKKLQERYGGPVVKDIICRRATEQ